MSNQLTPMQEGIEKIKTERENYKNLSQVHTYDSCIKILTEILPKEQQVIEDAVNDTNNKWYSSRAEVILKGSEYYNTKFKNNGK